MGMKFPYFSTVFGALMILGVLGMGVMHEQVHVQIYAGYGVESHVEYLAYFPNFVTVSPGCPQDKPMCNLAHDINEAVSYPLLVFYVVMACGIFLLIVLAEIKIKAMERNHYE